MASEESEDEKNKNVCEAELSFFGNITTVATLMLGFNVTGIAISMQFTGGESFRLDQVLRLGRWAVLSTVSSLIGTVVSLVLYAHGNLMSGFSNSKEASAFFQRMLPFGFIAELSVLLSMVFFFNCMSEYILMQYTGPDICPVGSNINEHRASTFCSLLGADFYEAAAREDCTDPDPDYPALCKEFAAYNNRTKETFNEPFWFGWNPIITWASENEKSPWSFWFGWDPQRVSRTISKLLHIGNQHTAPEERQERYAIIDQAANAYCRKNVLKNYTQAACSSRSLSLAAQSQEEPREKDFEDTQVVQEAWALAGKEATVQNRTPIKLLHNTSKVSSHSFASLLQVGHRRTEVNYALFTDLSDKDKPSPQTLVQQGQACAEAYTAFTHANSCVGGYTDDAEKCLKVCSWVDRTTPTKFYLQDRLVAVNFGVGIIIFMSVFARLRQYIRLCAHVGLQC